MNSVNDIFFEPSGQGTPLIVVHGGPGLSQNYLRPQLNRLAKNNFVIFYDQRGCGRSTGEITPETITLETYVKDLDALRQAFNFETVSILGHSWGGLLAMRYALAHPESVDKLILSNSMPGSSEGMRLFRDEWSRRMAPFQEEIAAIHQAPEFVQGDPALVEHLHRIIFRTYCYHPEKANLLNLSTNPTAAVNGAKVYDIFRQNVFEKPYDIHDALAILTMPTLIIHGDNDPIPASTAQKLHESIKNSQFILMHNCGHFPYVEEPDAYFEHLENFLKNCV